MTGYDNGTLRGAVIAINASMAIEFGPEKIRFNVINPALGVTGLVTNFTGGGDTPEMRERFSAMIPLRRLTTPRDIANAAVFLSSDEADFITGAVLQVDGGRAI